MKKIILCCITALMCFTTAQAQDFNGGTGTRTDPYLIATAQQLNNMRYFLHAHYKLQNDIDLSPNIPDWIPVGTIETPFTGSLNGAGFSIKNFRINSNEQNCGLFGCVDTRDAADTAVQNLTIANGSITSTHSIGAFVACLKKGVIDRCTNHANIHVVYAPDYYSICNNAAGIAGQNYLGSITNVTNHGEIYMDAGTRADTVSCGGIVGSNYNGNVLYATNYGKIIFEGEIYDKMTRGYEVYEGGIAGHNFSGDISYSINYGDMTYSYPYAYMGGIVGCNPFGKIFYSMNYGNLEIATSATWAGGIAGFVFFGGTLSHVYNSGNIRVISNVPFIPTPYPVDNVMFFVGGIVGHNWLGSIDHAYNDGNCSTESFNSLVIADNGGIVGWNEYGTILNTYNYGNIFNTKRGNAGGIAGNGQCTYTDKSHDKDFRVPDVLEKTTYYGLIDKCYASGSVTSGNIAYEYSTLIGGITGVDSYCEENVYTITNSVAINHSITCMACVDGNRINNDYYSWYAGIHNCYALASMPVNGSPIAGPGNANTAEGLSKDRATLQKRKTYAEDLLWTFGAESWDIWEDSSYCFFACQSAPVYLSSVAADFITGSCRSGNDIAGNAIVVDSLCFFNNKKERLGSIANPSKTWTYSCNSPLSVNDTIYVKAYESGKWPSYPVLCTTTAVIYAMTQAPCTITPEGTISVANGGSQTFTFPQAPQDSILEVRIDGVKNTEAANNGSYTFTNVTYDHVIETRFKPEILHITAEAIGRGTIEPEGVVDVSYGASQMFTVNPDDHYYVQVLVDGVPEGNLESYTFEDVSDHHTIVAEFKITTNRITAIQSIGGLVMPEGVTHVPYGGSQTYKIATFVGYDDYVIGEVFVDGVSIGKVETYTFENVTEPHTISATFDLVGINENNNKTSVFSVFPNPAQDFLTFSYSGAENAHVNVEIRDLAGRLVDNIILQSAQQQCATGHLLQGVYFATLTVNGKKTETQKIVIAK